LRRVDRREGRGGVNGGYMLVFGANETGWDTGMSVSAVWRCGDLDEIRNCEVCRFLEHEGKDGVDGWADSRILLGCAMGTVNVY